jgi:hypothetical protein
MRGYTAGRFARVKPNGVSAMSEENYAKWKLFQSNAAEAMATVDKGRGAEDDLGWDILARRAIALQELAIGFAKTVI